MSITLTDKEKEMIKKIDNILNENDEKRNLFFTEYPNIKNVYDTINSIMSSEEYKSIPPTAKINPMMYLYRKLEEIQKLTPVERIIIEKLSKDVAKKQAEEIKFAKILVSMTEKKESDGKRKKKKIILKRKY